MKTRSTLTLIASCLTLLSASAVFAQAADPAVKNLRLAFVMINLAPVMAPLRNSKPFPTWKLA